MNHLQKRKLFIILSTFLHLHSGFCKQERCESWEKDVCLSHLFPWLLVSLQAQFMNSRFFKKGKFSLSKLFHILRYKVTFLSDCVIDFYHKLLIWVQQLLMANDINSWKSKEDTSLQFFRKCFSMDSEINLGDTACYLSIWMCLGNRGG